MNVKSIKHPTPSPNENDSDADLSFFPQLVEIINVLHKHLPDEIPEVKLANAQKGNIYLKRELPMGVTINGELLKLTLPKEISTEIYDVLLLFRFLSQYKDDRGKNLWIVGLPWKFNGAEFFREYAHQLGYQNTREMLLSIGFSAKSIARYKRKFPKRCDAFQKQIIQYATIHSVQTINLNEFLIATKSDVTLKDIKKWKKMRLFRSSITITTKHKNHESIRIRKI